MRKIHLDDAAGLQIFNWTAYKSVGSPICADYNYQSSTGDETFRILTTQSNRSEIRIHDDYFGSQPSLTTSLPIYDWVGDWKGPVLVFPVLAKVSNPAKTEVDVVNVPTAVQSVITVIHLIDLPMGSLDYHAVLLANEILGGGTDAKLFRNLREKHDFTYRAYFFNRIRTIAISFQG